MGATASFADCYALRVRVRMYVRTWCFVVVAVMQFLNRLRGTSSCCSLSIDYPPFLSTKKISNNQRILVRVEDIVLVTDRRLVLRPMSIVLPAHCVIRLEFRR